MIIGSIALWGVAIAVAEAEAMPKPPGVSSRVNFDQSQAK